MRKLNLTRFILIYLFFGFYVNPIASAEDNPIEGINQPYLSEQEIKGKIQLLASQLADTPSDQLPNKVKAIVVLIDRYVPPHEWEDPLNIISPYLYLMRTLPRGHQAKAICINLA